MNIDEKISKIEPKIKEPFFLENKGLSNEVGYYIFDYNPKYELKVNLYSPVQIQVSPPYSGV